MAARRTFVWIGMLWKAWLVLRYGKSKNLTKRKGI